MFGKVSLVMSQDTFVDCIITFLNQCENFFMWYTLGRSKTIFLLLLIYGVLLANVWDFYIWIYLWKMLQVWWKLCLRWCWNRISLRTHSCLHTPRDWYQHWQTVELLQLGDRCNLRRVLQISSFYKIISPGDEVTIPLVSSSAEQNLSRPAGQLLSSPGRHTLEYPNLQ